MARRALGRGETYLTRPGRRIIAGNDADAAPADPEKPLLDGGRSRIPRAFGRLGSRPGAPSNPPGEACEYDPATTPRSGVAAGFSGRSHAGAGRRISAA